jgi:ABC-type spermidine/putrescine transport system permease subunit II
VALVFIGVCGWMRTSAKERRINRIGRMDLLSPRQVYGLAFLYLFVALQCILWLSGLTIWICLVVLTLVFVVGITAVSYSKAKRNRSAP